MQRTPSNARAPLPKLPPQRTKHQFSLKSLLICMMVLGPILALLVNHESVLISLYRYALLLVAAFPRNEVGFLLKFLAVGAIAFGVVPFCFAKLHPLFAWLACVLCGIGVVLLWRFALDNIVWHYAVDETSPSVHSFVTKKFAEDPEARMMLDFELATAATFVLLGIVAGGLVSLHSRKFS